MADLESQPADPDDDVIGRIPSADAPRGMAEARPGGIAVDAELAAEADAPEADAPEADAPEADAPEADAPGPAAGEARHGGLLGELARAMHAAAASQYERINAELEDRRAQQVEAIATRARSEIEGLKTGSQADVGAIDAWAKAETEKIKQERLRRIDARRAQLATQFERQEAIQAREVFAIEVAIDTHRAEIDAFFGRMERETDPAAIARVASMLPPFPAFAQIVDEARREVAAEGTSLGQATGPATAVNDVEREPGVSESRLMAVMDPTGAHGDGESESDEATRPWEAQPYAVSITAGPRVADEARLPARTGMSLLRSIPSIRPMIGRRDPKSGEEPDPHR